MKRIEEPFGFPEPMPLPQLLNSRDIDMEEASTVVADEPCVIVCRVVVRAEAQSVFGSIVTTVGMSDDVSSFNDTELQTAGNAGVSVQLQHAVPEAMVPDVSEDPLPPQLRLGRWHPCENLEASSRSKKRVYEPLVGEGDELLAFMIDRYHTLFAMRRLQ